MMSHTSLLDLYGQNVCALLLYQKLEAIIFLLQVFQEDARWLDLRVLHVIHVELCEVAGHYPAWTLGVWKHRRVSLRLLERSEQQAVALLDGLAQVLA